MQDLLHMDRKISQLVSFLSQFLLQVNPLLPPCPNLSSKPRFWIQLLYFLILSLLGYLALKISKPELSSMATVEMEVFSNTQFLSVTTLIFVGGEVFTPMLWLQVTRRRLRNQISENCRGLETEVHQVFGLCGPLFSPNTSRGGSTVISLYISFVPNARKVFQDKGIQTITFSIFLAVSTFANCVFVKNPGLLLLLIPQFLLGNTFLASCLRLVMWSLERLTTGEEYKHILKNYRYLGFDYLLSSIHSLWVVTTVLAFILSSQALEGLNPHQKVVGSLFQIVDRRYARESVVDLSVVSRAILVLFIVMMRSASSKCPRFISDLDILFLKELGCYYENGSMTLLVIFIILVCIAEREKLEENPLNYNVLNITFEVISTYGNVGLTTGYSCRRRLKSEGYCKDASCEFVGRWSNKGKLVLILVMLFGRPKNFSKNGSKPWKLS
ncbi:hypothetical protein NMG60_11030643 [Bertholletia excelsa]